MFRVVRGFGDNKLSKIDLKPEGTEPTAPSLGFIRLYLEGTTLKYKESNGTVHTVSEGVSTEEVQDIVAAMMADSTNIVWTYNDGANTLSADVSSNVMVKSLIDAKGDLLVGSADNTVVRLPVGANKYQLEADSAEASGLKWVLPHHRQYPYVVKTASYTVDLTTDTVIVFAHTSGNPTLTLPVTTGIPNDYYAREYAIANMGSSEITIANSGSDTFTDGVAGMKVRSGEIVRLGAGYPTIGPFWFTLNKTPATLQARKTTNWGAGNFTSFTGVPFNITDFENDSLRLERNITNTSRIDIKSSGPKKITFSGAIDSTGGGSYRVDFHLMINNTTMIPGSSGSVGNYQTEDSHFSRSVIYNFAAGDYLEFMLDHTNLTGNANNLVIIVEEA